MKKFLLVIALLLPGFCHGQWTQLTLPTASDVVSSSFITDGVGWIGMKNIGPYAIIYHTTDYGDTWTADTITGASGGSTYLQFVSYEIGYCVVNGEAFKTVDGGVSWYPLSLPGIPFNKPCFLNENTGFIIGDEKIFKTTDGGQTWNTYPVAFASFNELHFANDSLGIGCEYDGYLYKTTDGGETWGLLDDGGLWSFFFSACFSPDSVACYTGYTDVFGDVTVDIHIGMNTYSSYNVGNLYDIRSYTDQRIYAAGQYGDIAYTENGGSSWFNFNLPDLLGLSQKDLLTLDGFDVIYAFGKNGRGYRNLSSCVIFSDFSYTVNEFHAAFTDLTPGATNWLWTFDDGTTSTQQNPVHNFTEDGNYHVCLVAGNDSCSSYSKCQDIFICGPNVSASSSGSLDSSFSDDGIVLEYFDLYYGYCQALAIQQDHKIVGVTTGLGGKLVRLNEDGTYDNTFSNDGQVTLGSDYTEQAMALTSDDKILVGGDQTSSVALVRYESDGSLDQDFGINGKVVIDPTVASDLVKSFYVEDDGKMVLLDSYNSSGFSMHVIRLNEDGTFDSTFSGDGILDLPTDDYFFFNAAYGSIIPLSNGKMALAITTNTNGDDFAVARINSDGTLDASFSLDGIAVTNFSSLQYDYATDLAEQPDGKLVVVGHSVNDAAVARYNLNGSLDASFGSGGKITFQINNQITHAYALTLQDDGKMLITGKVLNNGMDKIFLVRLNQDGSFDTSFGNDGYVKTGWNCTQSLAYDVALDQDKIYVGGGLDGLSTDGGFAVIRYQNDCPGNVADFISSDTELSVQFTDQSAGAASWSWDFGDGTTSTDQSPLHVYAQEGSYQVCLTITGACGSNWFCQTISVCNALNTDYTYQATGLTIQFSNTTTEALTFLWNFGDGTTSAQQNPIHTFPAPGIYYVCLSETDECTDDAACQNIAVCGILNAGFSFVQNGNEIFFTDTSSNAINYLWDFGDGTTSTDQNPSHVYAQEGSYEVCMVASDACSSDTVCGLVTIIATTIIAPDKVVELEVFPNPFSGYTTIQFSLEKQEFLKIELEELTGRKIKTIAEGNFTSGNHQLPFESDDLQSGMYLLQLQSSSGIQTQKLILQSQ